MEVRRGYKLTDAGVIPEDWQVTKLARHVTFKTGPFGSALHKSDYVDDGVPVINPTQIADGRIRPASSMAITEPAARELTEFRLSTGDLIIGRRGEMGRCAYVQPHQHGWVCGTGSMIIRTGPQLEARFLQRVLSSPPTVRAIESASVGSTMINLNQGTLGNLVIPIPPTRAEQEAIAQVLSDADAHIESLEQLTAKKRRIKQSAMQVLLRGKTRLCGFEGNQGHKLTKLGVIPSDWSVVSASDVCAKIQDGTHFSPKLGGSDFLYITSKNIRFGYLDVVDVPRISYDQHRSIYRRCDVKKGDVLLTKDGANTGNAALNILDEEFSLLSSVAFLRFDPRKYCAAYFLQQILSSQGQSQIQEVMAGNAITRLTLGKIRKLIFPVPPTLAEQEAIAAILTDMDVEVTTLEAKVTKARSLKQGMMQELLTGRIRLV